MSLFHPSVRLPAWAAVAIVTAAYVVRSAIRGWDFRPDLPVDAVILIVLVAILTLRWYLARQGWDRGEPGDAEEDDGGRGGSGPDGADRGPEDGESD